MPFRTLRVLYVFATQCAANYILALQPSWLYTNLVGASLLAKRPVYPQEIGVGCIVFVSKLTPTGLCPVCTYGFRPFIRAYPDLCMTLSAVA
ncbi:hypothetical protein DT385_14575 [Pseudomonas syringae]|nr:hypothetical protein DT385_14575 [Pseudomonas syringae]